MAGRIPQPFIDEVVARSDIVEIIGARVPLKKSGREYKACCPFHSEKSPSFWVSPEKQFYHCFGCGAHGTVVGFLMQYEKLGFLDAVADLARARGIGAAARGARADASPAAAICTSVMARGGAILRAESWRTIPARAALPGAARRRCADQRQVRAGLRARLLECAAQSLRDPRGRAPPAAAGGIDHRARHARRPDAAGFYDRFRDRLMFPIRDSRGRVLGLRRPGHRSRRAEIPEFAGNSAVPQGPRAVRPVRGAPGAHGLQAPDDRRGLHGRGAAASSGHHLRGGHSRHGHHPGASAQDFPPDQRIGVLLRRRPRRTSGCLAGAGKRAAAGARRPRAQIHVSCPRVTIRTPWSRRRARRLSRAGFKAPCRCPNTWCSNCCAGGPRRTWTAAPSSRRWRRPCSRACPTACIGSCSPTGSPREIRMPAAKLKEHLFAARAPVRRRRSTRSGGPRRLHAEPTSAKRSRMSAGRGNLLTPGHHPGAASSRRGARGRGSGGSGRRR